MFLLTEEFLLWGERKKANTWSVSSSPGKQASAEQQPRYDLLIKLHSMSNIKHPCTNKKKQTVLLASSNLGAVNSSEYVTWIKHIRLLLALSLFEPQGMISMNQHWKIPKYFSLLPLLQPLPAVESQCLDCIGLQGVSLFSNSPDLFLVLSF